MSNFAEPLKEQIQGFPTRYETKRSAILPILHAIQDANGWIKDEHVEALDTEFGLHRVQVREVLTFYSMYRTKEPHKFEIYFCNNIVCHMMGADAAMAKIHARIDSHRGECPIGMTGVPCLGVCDGAPAMLVNKDRHLKVTRDNVDQILDKYVK